MKSAKRPAMQYVQRNISALNTAGTIIGRNVLNYTVHNDGDTTAYIQGHGGSRLAIPAGRAVELGNPFYPQKAIRDRLSFKDTSGSPSVQIYILELVDREPENC